MRSSEITRKTAETDIRLKLELDGRGESSIDTGCGFLDHMLTLFAKHGRFDLTLTCKGDTNVDYHHTVEDTGICLGAAFSEALGEMRGIARYGSSILPMDEALILCAVDFSGRSCLRYGLQPKCEKVGDFDTELAEEFWLGFVRRAAVTLHFRELDGENTHHVLEGSFKAAGHAFAEAVAVQDAYRDEIPSTKGVLK